MELKGWYDDKVLGRLGAILIALAFVQPVFTMVPSLFRIESTPFSIFYRILLIFISLYILFVRFFTRKNIRIVVSVPVALALLFWFFYLLRIFYDLNIRGLKFATETHLFVYSMALGNCLLPFVAVSLSALYIDARYLVRILYSAFIVSCLSSLLTIVVFLGVRPDMFSSRRLIDNLGVQVIKLSFDGEVLIVFSAFFLVFSKALTTKQRIGIICVMLLGMVSLIGGASRSPVLGTLFGLLLITGVYFWRSGTSVRKVAKALVSIGLVVSGFVVLYFSVLVNLPLATFQRLFNFFESRNHGGIEERDMQFASAWKQFLRSPVIGDSFLEEFSDFYPHNMVLEVLMSMGILGATLMFFVLSSVFIRIPRLISDRDGWDNELLVAIFFCLILFLSMFSGGLFLASYWWIVLAYMLIRSDLVYGRGSHSKS
jgi:O-antigen ligase